MKVTYKRYKAVITNRLTGETIEKGLYDPKDGEGVSGFGVAFKEAQKLAKENFGSARVAIEVFPIRISCQGRFIPDELESWTEEEIAD